MMHIELREFDDSYMADFLCLANDPEVARNTGSYPYPIDMDWVKERFKLRCEQEAKGTYVDRCLFVDDAFAGGGGYFINEAGETEIGYWIGAPFRGKGVATETGKLVIALARAHGYRGRLVAGYAKDNPASGRVLEKLGFCRIGESSFMCVGRGGEAPCWRYELLPE